MYDYRIWLSYHSSHNNVTTKSQQFNITERPKVFSVRLKQLIKQTVQQSGSDHCEKFDGAQYFATCAVVFLLVTSLCVEHSQCYFHVLRHLVHGLRQLPVWRHETVLTLSKPKKHWLLVASVIWRSCARASEFDATRTRIHRNKAFPVYLDVQRHLLWRIKIMACLWTQNIHAQRILCPRQRLQTRD